MKNNFYLGAFRRYLKAESMSEDSINQIAHFIEDFSKYGKRKPYMTAKDYNKQFDKAIKYLESLQYNLNNAFIVKLTSLSKLSWKNIKLKMTFFLEGVKKFLNEYDYYIWFKTIDDLNYEIYICFDFKDDNVQEQHVEYVARDQWYGCDTCDVTPINSLSNIIESINATKDQSLQEDKSLTWFLDRTKVFLYSPTFGIDKNKLSNFESKLDMIQKYIDDEKEYQRQLALEDEYYINSDIQPQSLEEIF